MVKIKWVRSDGRTIDTGDEYDIEYWARQFGVNSKEIIESVKRVGNVPFNVKKDLKYKIRSVPIT